MKISNCVFSPYIASGGLVGFAQMDINKEIHFDGILVFEKEETLSFKTPAKKLGNGDLAPFYSIIGSQAKVEILEAIKTAKAQRDKVFVEN